MLSLLSRDASPDDVAVITSGGDRLTYAGLSSAVSFVATALAETLGETHRRAIAVAAESPSTYLIAALAALECGGVVVPIDPRATPSQRTSVLEAVRPAALITGSLVDGDISIDQVSIDPRIFDERAAVVLSTSGSSGVPKRVVLGGVGLMANIEAIIDYLPLSSWRRAAVVLPLSCCYGLIGQCFTSLRVGSTIVLLGDVPYATVQVEKMRELGVDALSSVPASLRLIARVVCELPEDKRPKLGYVASAGGVLTGNTIELIREAFPDAQIFNQYGLTEASPRVTALDDRSDAFEKGSVGKPIRGVEVEVLDGNRRCAPGERGEIVVTGPSLMLEYLDDVDGTAAVLTSRGLRTGDIGYADADGYVYVEGRNDDLVNVAGERTSLHAVADSIRAIDGVNDAFVAAISDELHGTKLVAIVAADQAQLRELQHAARDALPPAQRPGAWLVVDELPRTSAGKLDRGKMSSWARAGTAH